MRMQRQADRTRHVFHGDRYGSFNGNIMLFSQIHSIEDIVTFEDDRRYLERAV